MAHTSFSVKYRPVKIGFLVKEGDINDLVKAAGINSLLWGGIYNPIIPVSSNKDFAEKLLNLFSVDILYALDRSTEIDELIAKYPYLKGPHHYNDVIFYKDWDTNKKIVVYLDSINIINKYWEKEFKHSQVLKSNCVLLRWNDDDTLKDLFSILFGFYPATYNLQDDFGKAFLTRLHAEEIKIASTESINKNIINKRSPILLTAVDLKGYGETSGNGIYIGNETDFTDLVYFWCKLPL